MRPRNCATTSYALLDGYAGRHEPSKVRYAVIAQVKMLASVLTQSRPTGELSRLQDAHRDCAQYGADPASDGEPDFGHEPAAAQDRVAGGPRKIEAIRAALMGRLVSSLITDEATARALLEPPLGTTRPRRKTAKNKRAV